MNVGSGVNVTFPASSTVHTPSPGTVTSSISPSPSVSTPTPLGTEAGSKFTVLVLMSLLRSVSFPSTFTVAGELTVPVALSSTATGGSEISPTTVGSSSVGALSSDKSVTGLPSGSVAFAVAWLATLPSTRSCAVKVYVALTVWDAPTARSDTGSAATPILASSTVMLLRGTLPVLVTLKSYTMVSPACSPSPPSLRLPTFMSAISGSCKYVTVCVTSFEVRPVLSVTLYVIGVGSPVNVGSGVNIVSPVVSSTVHVPSPGTTKLSLSPSPSVSVAPGVVIFTVLAFKSPSGSVSFPTVLSVTAAPTTLSRSSSSTARGAIFMVVDA